MLNDWKLRNSISGIYYEKTFGDIKLEVRPYDDFWYIRGDLSVPAAAARNKTFEDLIFKIDEAVNRLQLEWETNGN